MRRVATAAFALLLVAAPAFATSTLLGAFSDVCQLDTNATDFAVRWGAGASPTRCTALPAIETAILPAGTGNLCALRYALTSASSKCLEVALAAQSQLNLTCHLRVLAMDTAGVCEGGTNDGVACASGSLADNLGLACPEGSCVASRSLARMRNSAGTTGAILRMVRYNDTKLQLQGRFRSSTATTCNGSTEPVTNIARDDTPCTPTADPDCEGAPRDLTLCPEHNHCEARCDPQNFASALVPLNTDLIVTLQQENASDAEVAVRLWAGTGSIPSAAYSDGGGFKKVGLCSGGADDSKACLTDADCASPGTCDASRKITVDRLSLGADDTKSGAWDYVLDGCYWYTGDALPNTYWESLRLASTGAVGNWSHVSGSVVGCNGRTCSDTNLDACLADCAAPDGGASAITDSAATKPTAVMGWSAISTPVPAPTPLAALAEQIAQQTDATAPTLEVEFTTGATTMTSDFTPWTVAFSDHGASAAYHWTPPLLSTNATVLGNLGTVQTVLKKSADSHEVRVTSQYVSILRQTAAPSVPNVLVDRDNDGEKTICDVGDSIADNADFQATLTGLLFEPTNLIFGTMGNTTIRDAANNWSNLLEGATSGYLKAKRATRGSLGRTCDVVFVMMGTNEPHAGQQGRTDNLTTVEGGLGQAGLCKTASGSGPGQDQPCVCSDIPKLTRDPAVGYGLCVTHASSGNGVFGTHCQKDADCACTANADCTFGGTSAVCTSGACKLGTFAAGDVCKVNQPGASGRSNWCMAGCDNAPGCGTGGDVGVCMQSPTLAMAEADWTRIKTATASHVPPNPTPAATPSGPPVVIYVNPPSVVRSTNSGNSGALGCWGGTKHYVQQLGLWLRQQSAADPTMRFLDMDAVFNRDCPSRQTTGVNSCATDGVHPPPFGQQIMAQAYADCATNTDSVTGRTGITHDGTCDTVTTHVCTTGRVGYACTDDAWCDIWRCNLASP